jgi:hypothetical protein
MSKQTQWAIAGVVLCFMVFSITFFLNYIGEPPRTQGNDTPVTDTTQLAFPGLTAPVIQQERGVEGYVDFWFCNPNNKPIPVGLNFVNCQCASIELWTAQDTYWTERTQDAGCVFAAETAPILTGVPGLPAVLAGLMAFAVTENPVRMAERESLAQHRALRDTTVEVPAGAAGWLRLKWKPKTEPQQSQPLGAELWYHSAKYGPKRRLGATIRYHDPIRPGSHDINLSDLRLEHLPRSESLYIWSYTRPALDLKVVHVPLRDRVGEDTFVVGQPVPATPEEVRAVAAQMIGTPEDGVVFRCVYRIPYTLNAKSADGKVLCEQGGFTRRIEVSLADDPTEKVAFMIHGILRGDLRVEGSTEGMRMDLGEFRQSSGSRTESRVVATALSDLDLEIDRTRTSRHLSAKLEGPRPGADGGRTWILKVWVEKAAGNAIGRFPTTDNPDYLDSAVYIRPRNGDGRTLRIPVRGNATQ